MDVQSPSPLECPRLHTTGNSGVTSLPFQSEPKGTVQITGTTHWDGEGGPGVHKRGGRQKPQGSNCDCAEAAHPTAGVPCPPPVQYTPMFQEASVTQDPRICLTRCVLNNEARHRPREILINCKFSSIFEIHISEPHHPPHHLLLLMMYLEVTSLQAGGPEENLYQKHPAQQHYTPPIKFRGFPFSRGSGITDKKNPKMKIPISKIPKESKDPMCFGTEFTDK